MGESALGRMTGGRPGSASLGYFQYSAREAHSMVNSKLYRQHIIWRRMGASRAVRYICFESLSETQFSVQSRDWYYLPVSRELFRQHEDQAVELSIETDPQERNGSFSSLTEAIQAFDLHFENDHAFTRG